MKTNFTRQFKFTCFLIGMFIIGGTFESMSAQIRSEVNEVQKMIDEVPANSAKEIDLHGQKYTLSNTILISGGRKITLKNGTLVRNYYHPQTFISVSSSSLTLENIIIDGDQTRINATGPLINLNNSDLYVKAGAVIKNNVIVSSVTAGGVIVDSNSSLTMTGGEIFGCYDYDMGHVYIAQGGTFTMTGGSIYSVCTEGSNVTIGGAANITSYFRLYGGDCHLVLSSALQNTLPVWRATAQSGTIAAVGNGNYIPTVNDVAKFKDYKNKWQFDLKDGNIIFVGESSIVKSEDELQKKINAAPVGSFGFPTSITVGNVEITKGVTINGKYITLTGGTIIGNSSNSWISLKGGGLNLDQMNLTCKESLRGSPIYADGGKLIINKSTIDGRNAIGGAITVGSVGSIEINQGTINGIVANVNSSLTFNSGSATTILSKIPITFGGGVLISGGISSQIILTSAPKNKFKFLLTQGSIISTGGGGFILEEKYLSMFEYMDTDYRLVWENNQVLCEKINVVPSVAETENDLLKMIEALPTGSESNPGIIKIKNITLTKPLVVDGKYITFNGGTLASSNSSAQINIRKGGLVLDNISVSANWTTTGKLITVTSNGTLIIRSTAVIRSTSQDPNLIYLEAGSILTSDGNITGNISSSGTLYLNSGIINGQINSSGIFNLSGTVSIKSRIYLSGNAFITLTSIPKYKLQILTEGKTSTVVVKGGNGFTLSQTYLSMFQCITANWQFIWNNNQLSVVENQNMNYKVTWNTLVGVTVKPESGYNASSISKGGTFKFTIVGPSDKKIIVKSGATIINPTYTGIYTILDIQTDIQLTILLENKAEYTITMPSSAPGVIIQRPVNFTGKVKEGDSFTFKADPSSSSYAVGVKVNGQYIYRDYGFVNGESLQAAYTIYNIKSTIVIEIEAINLSTLNTTKTVTSTSGNLKSYITVRECCYLKKLILKGSVNVLDLIFMSNDLPDITSIDLSEAVVTGNKLTNYDFSFMYKLSEIILPASITEIEDNAFCYNPQLERVVTNRVLPPILGKDAFYNIPVSQITIIVPEGSGSTYRSATVWKNYKIVEATSTEIFSITFIKSQDNIKMVIETGYNPNRVVAGKDFKFRLESDYPTNKLEVSANGVQLIPLQSVYTIYSINENQSITVLVKSSVDNENVFSNGWELSVRGNTLRIKHPNMNNIPLYVASVNGTVINIVQLNGVYTELNLPAKGVYIVYSTDFSRKIMVK